MPRRSREPSISEAMAATGRYLKWAREIVEPNQAECARIMDIGQSVWNKWEKGTRAPDPYKMIEFCARFRVTMDYIYRGRLQGVNPELALHLAALHPELVLGHADTDRDRDMLPA